MKQIVIGILSLCLFISLNAQVSFVSVADGFTRPVDIAHDGVSEGLYIVEQDGKIIYLENDDRSEVTDLNELITRGGNEQGLLGLSFHPSYPQDNRVFMYYTAPGNDIVISSAVINVETRILDQGSLKTIVRYEQPFRNHNGGCLRFGPDGYLYIGTGDGGSRDDPGNRAQNLMDPLGKMLRIDIDNGDPYVVPDDNPFEDDDFALNEIWAYGLRNPWRFSFDQNTGDLWIGDVGQDAREEINLQPAVSAGGENYGWRCKEGNAEYITDSCDVTALDLLKDPYYDYAHLGNGCSITGGLVSYSDQVAELHGKYVYGDICSNNFWAIDFSSTEPINEFILDGPVGSPSTFGTDKSGRLYFASLSEGTVYELVGTLVSNESIAQDEIIVHPSLVDHELIIDGLTITTDLSIQVYSSRGQFVFSSELKDNRVDVSSLDPGAYVLSLESSNKRYVHRFIKN